MLPQAHRPRGTNSRKACTPCAYAKRRCDKSIPVCQRCLEREIDCEYPSARPYACRSGRAQRHAPVVKQSQSSGLPVPSPDDVLSLDFLGDDLPDNVSFEETGTSVSSLTVDTSAPASASSWFLQQDSWTIQHPPEVATTDDTYNARVGDLKAFIETVWGWLSEWVRDAQSPMMHRQLYADVGLPPCLQNAFSAAALYNAKTRANEEIIMGIIEKHADELLEQLSPLADSEADDSQTSFQTAENLARVQALFVFQFLRLFGSDIRQRSRAEASMATLLRMNRKMWESAHTEAYLETSLGCDGLFSQSLSFGGSLHSTTDPISQQWRNWLLAESVRRTWLMVNYTLAIYLTLRDGRGSCSGGVAFTAREGLWESQTPGSWKLLLQKNDPLFINCQEMNQAIGVVPVQEVDAFTVSVMSIMLGAQKLDLWRAATDCASLEASAGR